MDRPVSSPQHSEYRTSNRQSYLDDPATSNPFQHQPGDGADETFDVRADFDGRGPRWSQMYGKSGDIANDKEAGGSYRPVSTHRPPTGIESIKAAQSGEELVSVPVLGPEWRKAELHELTRRGQAEDRQVKRKLAWRAWTRDQSGLFGVPWLTRKSLVFFLFIFCVGLAVTLFFLIPRAPSFSFYEPKPFVVDNSTIAFSRTPTNFSFTGDLNLLADSTSSYLPVHFSQIQATVYDLKTDQVIATGDFGDHTIPHSSSTPVALPVKFLYSALNGTDTTWNDMYNACGHLWPGTTRPDLQFRLELRMSIVGLVGHPFSETQISNVACPFELSADSV